MLFPKASNSTIAQKYCELEHNYPGAPPYKNIYTKINPLWAEESLHVPKGYERGLEIYYAFPYPRI